MASETDPLLSYGQCGGPGGPDSAAPAAPSHSRRLNTFFGVVVPTVLSMFSIVLFLRIGFVVGHAGLLQALLMLGVAYVIIGLTILSICAISTNGAVRGGGAYFMISRCLGPELGGGIGLIFYLANVCGCGVYVLGLVEAILDTFGKDPGSVGWDPVRVLPQGYWVSLLYASAVLALCLLVCLVGAHIYARASFLIFLVVSGTLLSVLLSPLALPPRRFNITHQAGANRSAAVYQAAYTGFSAATLRGNLYAQYSTDYTTGSLMSFAAVFAVLFNGCHGIMAGANMSGELRNPSVSIPRGTVLAVLYSLLIYLLLFLLASSTCDRVLLQQDYAFLQRVNLWPPLVMVGLYCTSLSAAMSSLIGASRILHALACDELFGRPLAPAKIKSRSGNPWVSVLYTWALVQLVLCVGQLNSLAGLVTVFYLLAYAVVDLACLALEWASAPNFRPTFQFFSLWTCALGVLGCVVMMFVISAVLSSVALLLLLGLLLLLHYRAPTSTWGYISQALIFHQVRKYLLLLDVRKEHVKFWRPQVLLMVSNPRSSGRLIAFLNQLKKGGLFVLGHVTLGELDSLPSDPVQPQYRYWLSLVDTLGVKAFVDLTLAPSIRLGTQQLLRIAGLGGMKPNTLVLGFYDNCLPEDYFLQDPAFRTEDGVSESKEEERGEGEGEWAGGSWGVDLPSLHAHFPPVRDAESSRPLGPEEYVGIMGDALKMGKNLCLARYFSQLDLGQGRGWGRGRGRGREGERTIDVWPLDLLSRGPEAAGLGGVCSLFLLQMACVLGMSPEWSHAHLRVFLCVEGGGGGGGGGWVAQEETLRELLGQLRIRATIRVVEWGWGGGGRRRGEEEGEEGEKEEEEEEEESGEEAGFLWSVNTLLRQHSGGAAVRFLYLPRPLPLPARPRRYLGQLEVMTRDLGPTLLIHGLTPVTCTDL